MSTKEKPLRKKQESLVENICVKHDFMHTEITRIQKCLLNWYDKCQRVLPWRNIAKNEPDPNVRGYAVWVSEIMLQQTQVATVVSYFKKWMEKWPTVSALSSSTLEEVNKVWAGLGYYSRARRLHEGANIIMTKLNGDIPQTVDELIKLIPGIGLYSASAIASVAFQKPVGVVDGNVIRVLSRMRIIGAHVTNSGVRDHLWNLANKIVSDKRPGDFNQALMELGAVVCTPQNPKCSDCPVNTFCNAFKMVQKCKKTGNLDEFLTKIIPSKSRGASKIDSVPDIENAANCHLCLEPITWKENPQVTAYPCKVVKKSPRKEKVGVVVIEKEGTYLMTKRPDKGILAGLWEFPSVIFNDEANEKEKLASVDAVLNDFGVSTSMIAERKKIGEVVHIFSHIKMTYNVEYLRLKESIKLKNVPKELVWSTEEEIKISATSTAMKKIFTAVKNIDKSSTNVPSKKRRISEDTKQKTIKSFFT